jgi:hypothetical protein
MISKRKLTRSQRIALRTITVAEWLASKTPWILASGVAVLSIVFIQNRINDRVTSTCNLSVYKLEFTSTAFGPAYSCVSRAVQQGPAPTFKD